MLVTVATLAACKSPPEPVAAKPTEPTGAGASPTTITGVLDHGRAFEITVPAGYSHAVGEPLANGGERSIAFSGASLPDFEVSVLPKQHKSSSDVTTELQATLDGYGVDFLDVGPDTWTVIAHGSWGRDAPAFSVVVDSVSAGVECGATSVATHAQADQIAAICATVRAKL
jgi:hypothetical protein